jgi:hypothetical protein
MTAASWASSISIFSDSSHKGPAESPLALVIFGDFWIFLGIFGEFLVIFGDLGGIFEQSMSNL